MKLNFKYIILCFLLFSYVSTLAQVKMSLDECRIQAIAYNKELKKASYQKEESLANLKSAKTAFLPSVEASASWTYMTGLDEISMPGKFLNTASSESNALNEEFTGISNVWFPGFELDLGNLSYVNAGLSVTQAIYVGGKIKYLNLQATEGTLISNLNYDLKYAEVIEQTDLAYWNLAAIDAQVKLAIKYIDMLSSLEIQMLDLFELGVIPSSERLKVSVQKNEADLNLIRAKNRLQIAKMYLNKIIGKALDTDIQLIDQLSTNVSEFNFGISLDEALSNRSELKILEKRLNISEYDRKIIKSEYLPQIGIGVNYSTMFTNKTEDDGNLQTSYSGQISIPIFNWRQSQHKQKAARMRIRQLEAELDNASDLISLEFLQVRLQINEAFESIILAKKSISEAEESLKETKASFEVGLNNTSDLLNSQADWQQANTQLIIALVQYESLQTKWMRVTGNIIP